jgi:hypothetical protein
LGRDVEMPSFIAAMISLIGPLIFSCVRETPLP